MSSGPSSGDPLDLMELSRRIHSRHEHVPVGAVNDHGMTLAVNEAPYPWHEHPDSDELFLVLEGRLRLECANGVTVELGPFDTYMVPTGMVHRTTPLGRCVNLVFETADAHTRFLDPPSEPRKEAP